MSSSSLTSASATSVSLSHFLFQLNNFWRNALISFNFAELYITVKYRSSTILVIFCKILAKLWSFFDIVFVVRFGSVTFEGMHQFHWNFAELYITVKYRSTSILVIIRQVLAIALFRLSFFRCVDIGFCSIILAGMHWFYWKFVEGYITVKYRSSSILIIGCLILAKLWPFLDLGLLVCWYWFLLNE